MSISLAQLNALPPNRAADAFRSCCGSRNWVMGMVARVPFASIDAVMDAADEIWSKLPREDWFEAFTHHPRIGQTPAFGQDVISANWSAREQSRATGASASVLEQLAEVNRAYEARFGYIYIVSAEGRTAEELLAVARERMLNEPAAELRVAGEEQRKITRLRLQKLFSDTP